MNAKEEFAQLRLDLGFAEKVLCPDSEQKEYSALRKAKQPLPEDVFYYPGDFSFYRIVDKGLTAEEEQQLIQYRQTNYLYSIKSSLGFFVVLAVIGIILGIISFVVR